MRWQTVNRSMEPVIGNLVYERRCVMHGVCHVQSKPLSTTGRRVACTVCPEANLEFLKRGVDCVPQSDHWETKSKTRSRCRNYVIVVLSK